jgi:tRNA-Thr(GGU) m(6)t(6)A37 methyltransferase TsaA
MYHNAPSDSKPLVPTVVPAYKAVMRTGTGLIPIGVIRTPFCQAAGTPIQPVFAEGAMGRVEVRPKYAQGLAGLSGFERIWLIYPFDRVSETRLTVVPYRDRRPRGVFATRAPCRPNRIGLSCVRLLSVQAGVLHVADVDILDETPLWDIKPYIAAFDAFPGVRSGWMDASTSGRTRADERFHRPRADER